jgi:hypothetical protein
MKVKIIPETDKNASIIPQVIIDAICGIVHDIAYDLAADGADFNKVRSVQSLVAACTAADATLYETFAAARDSAVTAAATDCGESDSFEPCTQLNLPRPKPIQASN